MIDALRCGYCGEWAVFADPAVLVKHVYLDDEEITLAVHKTCAAEAEPTLR